jgi:hypothetical protein
MAYELEKDVCVFEKSTDKIELKVMAYDGGLKKIQISRFFEKDDGGKGFAKLGRISYDEMEKLLPIIKEAMEVK